MKNKKVKISRSIQTWDRNAKKEQLKKEATENDITMCIAVLS